MLFALRPVVLETQGLVVALEQYADRLRQIEAFDVIVDPDSYDGQLSKMTESVVFGVIEEAVGNAKRHAEADQILIRLKVDDRLFTAEVSDNGRGFDVEALRKRSNAGARRLEERAEIVGGRCLIQSQPGTGTVVLLEIPLQPASSN
jgi:signal transduction histidine kinase